MQQISDVAIQTTIKKCGFSFLNRLHLEKRGVNTFCSEHK